MTHSRIRVREVHLEGARALIHESGDAGGQRIVLLPSMLVIAKSYYPTIRALARAGMQVFAIEMPGMGNASRVRQPWSFTQYVRWLDSFWTDQQIGQVTLIGHSNSAAVALPFAAAHPQRVGNLVLVDPIGGEGPARSLLGVVVRRAIDAVCCELPISAAGWHHVAYNMIRHAGNFWNEVKLAARTDLRELVGGLKVPTLLAWGARDHTMPIAGLNALRERIPCATVYLSEAGSHDWIVARPREFAQMIRAAHSATSGFPIRSLSYCSSNFRTVAASSSSFSTASVT